MVEKVFLDSRAKKLKYVVSSPLLGLPTPVRLPVKTCFLKVFTALGIPCKFSSTVTSWAIEVQRLRRGLVWAHLDDEGFHLGPLRENCIRDLCPGGLGYAVSRSGSADISRHPLGEDAGTEGVLRFG